MDRTTLLGASTSFFATILLAGCGGLSAQDAKVEDPWVVYQAGPGPGAGKHIVLISGDEEYRSEEALPQLGKILATHHGFTCTVLFAIDPETGEIDPNNQNNIPGLEALGEADLMVIATRFRDLPDEQMKHIVDYVESGRPVVGIRTATHAFQIPRDKTYARYGSRSRDWDGGFGRQVLGEDWINHHGRHGRQSTRGVVADGMGQHPIVRGCEDIWGPTDVYEVRLPMLESCTPLILGQVIGGMSPDDEPVSGEKNDPVMPVAWTNSFQSESDTVRVFTTTMGASQDLQSEGLRRLLVNACYWTLGMEEQIPDRANVDLVGDYRPTSFGFGGFREGVMPAAHKLAGR
jgi:hypothetical protein